MPDQDEFCAVCESYVHPYLDRCPACGNPSQSELLDALIDWRENWPPKEFDWDQAEEKARRSGNEELAEMTARSRASVEESAELQAGALDVMSPRSYMEKLQPRYLGGLATLPYQADIDWQCSPREGWLRFFQARGGSQVLAIHASQILCTTSYQRDSAVTNNWYGIGFGNVITFVNPTFHGGGATITYSIAGQIGQVSLGNRTGMFTRMGQPAWWWGFANATGWWARRWARTRAGQVGAAAYARELGFPVDDYLAALPPPAKSQAEVEAEEEADAIQFRAPYVGPRSFVQERETADQVAAALRAGVDLRNILFIGQTAKLAPVAAAIAQLRGGATREITVADVETAGDFAAASTSLAANDVLLLPDLDSLSSGLADPLAQIFDSRSLTVVLGQGSEARNVTLQVEPFTIIAHSASGTVPPALADWDVQLPGAEAHRLLDALGD